MSNIHQMKQNETDKKKSRKIIWIGALFHFFPLCFFSCSTIFAISAFRWKIRFRYKRWPTSWCVLGSSTWIRRVRYSTRTTISHFTLCPRSISTNIRFTILWRWFATRSRKFTRISNFYFIWQNIPHIFFIFPWFLSHNPLDVNENTISYMNGNVDSLFIQKKKRFVYK